MLPKITAFMLFSAAALNLGCGSSPNTAANSATTSGTNSADVCNPPATDTPTEAYKRLYAAVKAKDMEAIKKAVTKSTIGLAQSSAQMQKKPVESVLQNGFTATTFSETLPEIRDERVKDCMGAVEVWNSKDSKWEDLPFVAEDGIWKLAVGDLFADKYKSPGKGRAQKENEASNTVGRQPKPPASDANNPTLQNTNSNSK